MMTIKDVIKQVLKNACHESTERVREKDDKKQTKCKFDRGERMKLKAAVNAVGWTGATEEQIMKMLAIVAQAPELAKNAMIVADIFSVVVLEVKGSGHGYGIGVPLISTTSNIGNSSKSMRALDVAGGIETWQWDYRDNPRLATEEEIDKCIESLTDGQWATIMTKDLFKPIISKAMGVTVEVGEKMVEELVEEPA